jgi:hypothetical protein
MLKNLQQWFAPSRAIMLIEAVHAEGTVTVRSLSGQPTTAIGTGTIGQHVYVENGRVIGDAPSLPYFEVDV